jgi:transposase
MQTEDALRLGATDAEHATLRARARVPTVPVAPLAWLARHQRWTFHFTPTSCSWLNAVETFFATLTKRRLRRGSFHSLVALQEAINRYLAEHNRDPRPFVWTADPDAIVERVRRGYHTLASLGRQTG